jgi:hypothetical protein
LPFFPAASLAYGEGLGAARDLPKARKNARKAFAPHGPDVRGEEDDAATKLCFRGRDPLASDDFAAWAERIHGVLAACEDGA